MEVNCALPGAATQLIRDGTIMEGKILTTRKKLIEPKQCMKCQEYGHKALRCRSKNDICANCADTHRTSECSSPIKKCSNCASDSSTSKHDHHASNRMCPAYIQQVELMRRKHPDNRYRFFPVISDPTSWDTGDFHPQEDPNKWYGAQRTAPAPRHLGQRTTPAWTIHTTPNTTPRATPRQRARASSNASSTRSDMSLGTQRSSLCQTTLTGASWSRVPTPTPPNDE
jgi:hypothetical protein